MQPPICNYTHLQSIYTIDWVNAKHLCPCSSSFKIKNNLKYVCFLLLFLKKIFSLFSVFYIIYITMKQQQKYIQENKSAKLTTLVKWVFSAMNAK